MSISNEFIANYWLYGQNNVSAADFLRGQNQFLWGGRKPTPAWVPFFSTWNYIKFSYTWGGEYNFWRLFLLRLFRLATHIPYSPLIQMFSNAAWDHSLMQCLAVVSWAYYIPRLIGHLTRGIALVIKHGDWAAAKNFYKVHIHQILNDVAWLATGVANCGLTLHWWNFTCFGPAGIYLVIALYAFDVVNMLVECIRNWNVMQDQSVEDVTKYQRQLKDRLWVTLGLLVGVLIYGSCPGLTLPFLGALIVVATCVGSAVNQKAPAYYQGTLMARCGQKIEQWISSLVANRTPEAEKRALLGNKTDDAGTQETVTENKADDEADEEVAEILTARNKTAANSADQSNSTDESNSTQEDKKASGQANRWKAVVDSSNETAVANSTYESNGTQESVTGGEAGQEVVDSSMTAVANSTDESNRTPVEGEGALLGDASTQELGTGGAANNEVVKISTQPWADCPEKLTAAVRAYTTPSPFMGQRTPPPNNKFRPRAHSHPGHPGCNLFPEGNTGDGCGHGLLTAMVYNV